MCHELVHSFHGEYAEHHPDIAECGGNHHRFGQDQPDDRRGFGSERLANAEFEGALLHRYQHDVAHAHDACEQRPQTDDPDEEVDAAEDEHHVLVTFHAVVDPDGAFVVGREGVFGGQTIAEPLFEFGHLLIGVDVFHRKIGLSYARIAVVEEQLGGRQRDEGECVGAELIHLENADDAVRCSIDQEVLSDGTLTVKQDIPHVFIHDDHLAPLPKIGIVQEASVEHPDIHDFAVFRVAADYGRIVQKVASVGEVVLSRSLYAGGNLVHFGKFGAQDLQVAVGDVDAPPLVVALVGLRGPAAVDDDRIDGHRPEIGERAVF